MKYILTERQLKVLVEQTTKQTIPLQAYQKMIDGLVNFIYTIIT